MVKETFEKVKSFLIKHEGGYTSDARDPGNWSTGKVNKGALIGTNWGISAPTFIAYMKNRGLNISSSAMAQGLRELTKADAFQIYKVNYWDKIKGDELPAGLDYTMFDFAVNSGPAKAIMTLQKVLGVAQDGILGPITLKEANKGSYTEQSILLVNQHRLDFMKSLSTWPIFGTGWGRRVEQVKKDSWFFLEESLKEVQQEKEASEKVNFFEELLKVLKGLFK